MTLPTARFGRGIKEALGAINRDQGSGGGSGFLPLANLGDFAGGSLGAYATGGAGTWTDIAGTSFNIQIGRTTAIIYWVFATAGTTPAVGYVRGNIVGYDVTNPMYFGGSTSDGFMWYYSAVGPIQPGPYVVKMQAATDNGSTITVSQGFHQVFDLGA